MQRYLQLALLSGVLAAWAGVAGAEDELPVDASIDVIAPAGNGAPDMGDWADRLRARAREHPLLRQRIREQLQQCVADGACDQDGDGLPDPGYVREHFRDFLPDRDGNGVPDDQQLRSCVADHTCDANGDGRPDRAYLDEHFGPKPNAMPPTRPMMNPGGKKPPRMPGPMGPKGPMGPEPMNSPIPPRR